jgi:adenylate cyclase
MSATPENTSADTEHLIADLRRRLAERDAELAQALEQQTAIAEVLQVINSSPRNLVPVFDAILEKAIRVCSATFGIMASHDNGRLTRVAARGLPAAYKSWHLEHPLSETPFVHYPPPLQRVLAGELVVHAPDFMADESYRQGNPDRRALVDLAGARSGVTVALRNNDVLHGVITIFRQQVRPFSDKEIRLLQIFAAQAVVAMENARLLTETREALEQQTATAEVLQTINSSPGNLAPIFDAILEKALQVCSATFGMMASHDNRRLTHVAARELPAAYNNWRVEHPLPEISSLDFPRPLHRILAGDAVVHEPDLMASEAYRQGNPERRALVDLAGARSQVMVALRNDDTLHGAIMIFRQEMRAFSDKQIALLQNFAAQAVIAMENARLLGELRERTDQVAELNRGLEARVFEQVEELGRVARLKRFLAPQLAELIVSQGDEKILESHRREIVVVFCDLRGYTAFAETAEPEEVLDFLREYHGTLGPLVRQFEGTLEQFSGDGITVFFNDPVPCHDPAERAVKMAVAMREAAGTLITKWRRRGRELGFGAGVAQGYATLGQIGFAEHVGYAAIGTVCNVAARLCAEAKDGQILVAQRVAVAVEETTVLEAIGAFALKGLTRPVVAFNVLVPGGGATASPRST